MPDAMKFSVPVTLQSKQCCVKFPEYTPFIRKGWTEVRDDAESKDLIIKLRLRDPLVVFEPINSSQPL